MNAIVIEHVKVSDLPDVWRTKLNAGMDARVTVRIEEEIIAPETATKEEAESAFGMWRNREDMADPEGYVRRLRGAALQGRLRISLRSKDSRSCGLSHKRSKSSAPS